MGEAGSIASLPQESTQMPPHRDRPGQWSGAGADISTPLPRREFIRTWPSYEKPRQKAGAQYAGGQYAVWSTTDRCVFTASRLALV
jgi:hypothetical protein